MASTTMTITRATRATSVHDPPGVTWLAWPKIHRKKELMARPMTAGIDGCW
jgi:hypothetical protein